MTTVHLIPHAHLDPVWLWPWTAGLDEALATCRSACDLLDRHEELTFNLGDVWVLERIEQTDPRLFERIRRFVADQRWDVNGGWYIQPDCNLPRGFSIARQIQLGCEYLQKNFGVRPNIAMNVDSFGHAAALPGLMRDQGQTAYVMMRPAAGEMKLPARLFRWEEPQGGQGRAVTTFRIAGAYQTGTGIDPGHVHEALTDLPVGLEHTMCFVGVGDHGGGPTQAMIQWCRDNRHAFDGAELMFSTPRRFFEAVRQSGIDLPMVRGELQRHAVGCYSVQGALKRNVRRAEHLLQRAEYAHRLDPAPPSDAGTVLSRAWRDVCFAQFHDTLGGTCLPSTEVDLRDDVGRAAAAASQLTNLAFRRRMNELPDDENQRIVVFNPTGQPFDGYIETEPWSEFTPWQAHWSLLDSAGRSIAYQVMKGEASSAPPIDRVTFRTSIEPGQFTVIGIDRAGDGPGEPTSQSAHHAGGESDGSPQTGNGEPGMPGQSRTLQSPMLGNTDGVGLSYDQTQVRGLGFDSPFAPLTAPRLHLIDDPTDTWSHGIDRYAEGPAQFPAWSAPIVVDRGPLMSSIIQEGMIGQSSLTAEWRVYAAMPWIELRLNVNWQERHRVLKLTWPLPIDAHSMTLDGTLGGQTARSLDGRENPLQDWTRVELITKPRAEPPDAGHESALTRAQAAVVCPDSFAGDAMPDRLRLTLLRSPVLAHHVPNPGIGPRRHFADRGEHHLRLRFFHGQILAPQMLSHEAHMMHNRPLIADLTRGMPGRPLRNRAGVG